MTNRAISSITLSSITPSSSVDPMTQHAPRDASSAAPARARARSRPPRADERGEGVISAAIAVLIMAFIGVAMWVAFSATFQQTAKNVDRQVNCIGQTTSSGC